MNQSKPTKLNSPFTLSFIIAIIGLFYQQKQTSKPMLLHAQLFGSFQLIYKDTAVLNENEVTIPLPSRSTAKTLLAYLLLQQNKTHTRAQLAYLLAPDASEERARRTLSQALWQLRQSITLPLIDSDSDHIRILPNAPLTVDISEFNTLISVHSRSNPFTTTNATALQQAITLYRGDLLDGFYDDWTLLPREKFREEYLQTLWVLSNWEKENGRIQNALNHLRQLLQTDPLQEAAHREVMRCYALLQRPEAALRQFDLCHNILATELQLEPEPATIQLRQEIIIHRKTNNSTPHQPILKSEDGLPLVGRDEERANLLHLIKNGSKQQGSMALIESPAGTGKTRLLQTIAQDATWRNYQVLWGNATETGASVPYGTLITAIKNALTPLRIAQLQNILEPVWLNLIAHLFPELATTPAQPISTLKTDNLVAQVQQDQMRLLEAFIRLLIAWSNLTPILLVLEDVHQADSATFDMLNLLAHRLTKQRIVLFMSYRGNEARQTPFIWDGLQTLDETAVSLRLTLNDLSTQTSSQLIRTALNLDTPAPIFEQRIHQSSGGNPLFILEILRNLRDNGILHRDPQGEWVTEWDNITVDYSEINIPQRLNNVIQQRINQLTPDTLQLLKTITVLENEFNLPLLKAISPLDAKRTLTAMADLIQHQFIKELPATYIFNHQTIQQAAYASLPTNEKQQAHQQVAQALTIHHPQAIESIANHYQKANLPAQAIPYYQKSAQNALQQFALATARLHLDNAIALATQANLTPDEQFILLAQREEIAKVMGDNKIRGYDLAQMAQIAQNNRSQSIQTECRYIHYYTNADQPDFDQAIEHAQNALTIAQQMDDPIAIAAVHAAWGHSLSIRGDMEEALSHFASALDLHRQIDDPQAHTTLLLNYATALRMVAQHHDALQTVQTALTLLEKSGDKTAQVNALSELAVIHHEQGNTESAITYYRQTLDLAREIGYRYREATVLVNWGNLLWFEGGINQTLAHYEAASIIFGELGNVHLEAQLRGNLASFLLYPFADFALARHHAEWALAQCRQLKDLIGVGQALTTLSSIALEEGDLEQAEQYVSEALDSLRQSAGASYLFVMVLRDGAVLALAQQQPQKALGLVDEALLLCAESGMADIEVLLTAVRGTVLLQLNKPQEALAATSCAMEKPHDGVNQDYIVPWRHGQVLAALNMDIDAAQAIDKAYQLLQTYVAPLTPAQKQQSLTKVADHRAIIQQWQAGQQQIIASLPAIDAPTGRPLTADEFIEVKWTTETVSDTAVSNKKDRRQQQLLRLLNEARIQNAAPTIQDLATALNASPGTIKRDLATLRQAGHKTPTRGSR